MIVPKDGHAVESGSSIFPDTLAKVIYQEKAGSRQQIYIVAQSHRSALSGEIGKDTLQVQAEIYRIGEWLVKNRGLGVLLPEGYFQNRATGASSFGSSQARSDRQSDLSDGVLLKRLAAPDRFVNACLLLHDDFDIALQQIEDKGLHANVCFLLRELNEPASGEDRSALAAAFEYQQKKRSALLLRNIPEALAKQAGDREPRPANVLLTVGLSHVQKMIDYLKKGRAVIDPATAAADEFTRYSCDLAPLINNYGIIVLLPPTLAKNKDLCQLVTFN